MALTLESVYQLNFDGIHLLMIGCAILLPVFTFWLMIKYFAPSFAIKLAALNNDAIPKNAITHSRQEQKSISEKLSAIFCTSKAESSSFEMVWKITGRDKGFKIQFYPSLAYIFVFIFIFVFKNGNDVSRLWQDLSTTNMFLFFVYLPMLSVASSLGFIAFHENFQASWIYQSAPLAKPGQIISGSIKALLSKFFIPIFLIFFIFSFYVWGIAIVDDFVLGFFNNILIFLLIATMSDHTLPFSRQQNTRQQSGRFLQVILHLIIIGVLVGLHYLILKNTWLVYCLIPLSAACCYMLFKRIRNLPWVKISV